MRKRINDGIIMGFCILIVGCWMGYGNLLTATTIEERKPIVHGLIAQKQWQAAVDTLNSMRLESLEDPELYYLLGKSYSNLDDAKNAEVALKMALYFKKNYAEANYELGWLKMKQKLPGEAIFFFDQVLQLKPDWPQVQRRLGEAYYLIEKYQSALDAFNGLIKLHTDDYESYYFVACIRYQQKMLDAAVWNLEQALRIKRDYYPALKLLSQIYFQSDRPLDALPYLEQILVIAPDSLKNKQEVSALFFERGNQWYQKDSLARAIADFQNVLTLNPNNRDVLPILDEIRQLQNYDSLMRQATDALQSQNLEQAQNYFSKAQILATSTNARDSANIFLDSVTVMLNLQKYESEITVLYEQAEKAFSQGDYDHALEFYQKILLLKPADEVFGKALSETGSLKYFLIAIDDWNHENWDAAEKNFEQAIAFYPQFPGIQAKLHALKQIRKIENQRNLIHTALRLRLLDTAEKLFEKLFQLDRKNPRLYETWFEIKSLLASGKTYRILWLVPAFGVLLGALLLLSVWFIQRQKHAPVEIFKVSHALLLLLVPLALLIGCALWLVHTPKTSDVQLEVATEQVSFSLAADQELATLIRSDSMSLTPVNEMILSQVKFPDPTGVRPDTTQKIVLRAENPRRPLELHLNNPHESIQLKHSYFNCDARLVMSHKPGSITMFFYPDPTPALDSVRFTGTVNVPNDMKIHIPTTKNVISDSSVKATKDTSTEISVTPLNDSSSIRFEVSHSNFQILLKNPRQFQFHNLPIQRFSVLRFFPGDGIIQTISGLRSAVLTLAPGTSHARQIKIQDNFYFFPNNLILEKAESNSQMLVLTLRGQLTHFEIHAANGQIQEVIPDYFTWLWETWPWVILLAIILAGAVSVIGIRRLRALLNQPQIPLDVIPAGPKFNEKLPVNELIQPIHTQWQQQLTRTIIPQWQEKVQQLENEIKQEKNKRKRYELNQLLNATKIILQQRINESDAINAGEKDGRS